MDSNVLEMERGITILSKNTAITWKAGDEPYCINIVDTPGHADFGGEVERIMSMVDGVALVVDATEGPMAQTKFVLQKALNRGLHPLVVINKVDRPSARIGAVEGEIFDLFDELGANDEQMDFPIVYASAMNGWCSEELDANNNPIGEKNFKVLLDEIVKKVPPPNADREKPFSMLVTNIHR